MTFGKTSHALSALLAGMLASAAAAHGGGDYRGPGDLIPPGNGPRSVLDHGLNRISHGRAAAPLPTSPATTYRYRLVTRRDEPSWNQWWDWHRQRYLRVRELSFKIDEPAEDTIVLGVRRDVDLTLAPRARDRRSLCEMLLRVEQDQPASLRAAVADVKAGSSGALPGLPTLSRLADDLRPIRKRRNQNDDAQREAALALVRHWRDARQATDVEALELRLVEMTYLARHTTSDPALRQILDALRSGGPIDEPRIEACRILAVGSIMAEAKDRPETAALPWLQPAAQQWCAQITANLERPNTAPQVAAASAAALARVAANDAKEHRDHVAANILRARRIHDSALVRRVCLTSWGLLGVDTGANTVALSLSGQDHAWAALAIGLHQRHAKDPAFEEFLPSLRQRAGNAKQPDRGAYVIALGLARDLEGAAAFADRIRNPARTPHLVEAELYEAIGLADDRRSAPSLLDRLPQLKRRPNALLACSRALGCLGHKGAADQLLQKVDTQSDVAASVCLIGALGEIGDRRHLEALSQITLDSKVPTRCRVAAAHALARITHPHGPAYWGDDLKSAIPFFATPEFVRQLP